MAARHERISLHFCRQSASIIYRDNCERARKRVESPHLATYRAEPRMATPGEIFEFLFQRCCPATLPGLWRRFRAAPSFAQPPEAPAALLTNLQAGFSQEDLENAGVVVATSDGVHLHPSLTDRNAVFQVV